MAEDAQKNIGTWYIDPDAEDRMADGHAPIWRHLIDLMLERDLSDKNVLDYGCNQGGLLRHLYAIRPFRRALGIDIAETSIAKAETLKGNLPIQHQVGGRLEGWSEEFDLAVSHEVIYLVPDIDAHAADIRQALKSGGVYYAVTGCHTDNPLCRNGASSSPTAPTPSFRIGRSPITAVPSKRRASLSPRASSNMTASSPSSRTAGRLTSPMRWTITPRRRSLQACEALDTAGEAASALHRNAAGYSERPGRNGP